ncbi:MAG: DUF1156 domain-containing protein [Thaumarchaeota archaeon]|nr:DUF1156 domain-containing protein [Nitrososphaerota archaeon]
MKPALIENSDMGVLEFFNQVSKAAKKEKQATISLNQMMYWWTRKPLVVGRAMVLASLLDNLDDVGRFMGLDSPASYNYQPPLEDLSAKLDESAPPIKILDPFGGSGNLVFPAASLGLDVTVSDYNPVAWLIEKAALEFPATYGPNLCDDFLKHANKVVEDTKREAGKYFDSSHLTYLWSWCIRCPYCSQRFPLLNHMYVAKTSKRKVGVRITPKANKDFGVDLIEGISDDDGTKYTQRGGKAVCISCTNTIQRDVMANDIAKRKDREMIAIQIQKQQGRDYILPTKKDKKQHLDAIRYFEAKKNKFIKSGLIPQEEILASHRKKNTLWNYGITTWDQYFDQRQMLVMCLFAQNIKKVCSAIPDKSHQRIIATYLTFVLAKRVDNAVFGVIWGSSREMPVHALTMRQPRLSYNFAESNPFEKISGSIINIIQSISRSIKFAQRLRTAATCENKSVTSTSDQQQYDLIITDPPYGDDVQYGELSEFFYVWMYRTLSEYYHELPPRIPLDEDYCESQGRFSSKETAKQFFGSGLKKSFKSLNTKLKDDGLLVILFAHSSTEAWNQFLAAIREARFRIVSSYAVHTELATNPLARNKASFMSSIMVTCRKINTESVRFFEDLIPEIDDSVRTMLGQIPDRRLLTLPITDLLLMVYGKVLEISTQHTELKSYAKDFVPDFETLIKGARSAIIRELMVKLLKKQPNVLGSKMAFYLINKIFNNGQIPADDALKFAQAYDTTIPSLAGDGVITQKGSTIHLNDLRRDMDYPPDSIDPQNLYQQLCYLASHQTDVAELLHHDNIRTSDLKPIVGLLIKSHNIKKNQNHAHAPSDIGENQMMTNIASHMGITVDYSYGLQASKTKQDRAKKSMGDDKQSRLGKWK